MEHSCHKCGASVEEGVPFCMQCGAPQIRVTRVEPPAPAAAGSSDAGQAEVSPLVLRGARPPGVQWSKALPGAALGGVVSLAAAVVPFALLGPAFFLGGAVSAMLYRRREKHRFLTTGEAAQIGVASGGIAFLGLAIPLIVLLVHWPNELRQWFLDMISQAIASGYDPQRFEPMQQLLKPPGDLTLFVKVLLFTFFVISVLGSSIGGWLYAAWTHRRISM